MYQCLALILACLALSVPASAQTTPPQNPNAVVFTPSSPADHDQLTAYEATILDSAGAVVQVLNLGKPALCPTTTCPATVPAGDVFAPLNVQPIKFGSYTIVIRGVAGAVRGPQSDPSNVWERAPGKPGKPTPQ